jgi:hypothetical protein
VRGEAGVVRLVGVQGHNGTTSVDRKTFTATMSRK